MSRSTAVVLSDRQLELLRWISVGLTACEIAAEMWWAVDTVKHERMGLYRMLGARNAAHAVRLGFELGLLSAS